MRNVNYFDGSVAPLYVRHQTIWLSEWGVRLCFTFGFGYLLLASRIYFSRHIFALHRVATSSAVAEARYGLPLSHEANGILTEKQSTTGNVKII